MYVPSAFKTKTPPCRVVARVPNPMGSVSRKNGAVPPEVKSIAIPAPAPPSASCSVWANFSSVSLTRMTK